MTRRGRVWFVLLLILLGVGGYTWVRAEGEPPSLLAPESLLLGAEGTTLALEADDARSGLRSIDVVLSLPGGEETLLHEDYPGGLLRGGAAGSPLSVSVAIDAKRLGSDGSEGFLRVTARDWSLRGLLSGNATLVEIPVRLDLSPPRISIETGLSYAQRGGAGVVVYSVSEQTQRDGVRVGEAFFRSYPWQGRRAAFYAVPTDAPSPPRPVVLAVDLAGNERTASWPLHVKERVLPEASVNPTMPQVMPVPSKLPWASEKPWPSKAAVSERARSNTGGAGSRVSAVQPETVSSPVAGSFRFFW